MLLRLLISLTLAADSSWQKSVLLLEYVTAARSESQMHKLLT